MEVKVRNGSIFAGLLQPHKMTRFEKSTSPDQESTEVLSFHKTTMTSGLSIPDRRNCAVRQGIHASR
jgi:hypothetical protein